MTDIITLPRSVIEQAIDTIGYYASVVGEDDQDSPAKQKQSALRAALSQQAEQGWQPIETAPHTVNSVLALSESGSMKIETGFWLVNLLHASKVDGDNCNYTHWMPLPTPPKGGV